MQIDDKVALVTGGASGIGRATVRRLRELGARVVLADIDERLGRRTAEELDSHFLRLDVADTEAWSTATDEVLALHGRLDIAHLNAGVLMPRRPQDGSLVTPFDVATMSDEQYHTLTRINLGGVVFGTRAAARAMEGGGVIVVTSSMAGLVPMPSDPIYAATKHALIGFVRSAAQGLSNRGIRIQAVCPGFVQTPIAAASDFQRLRVAGLGVMEPTQIADAVIHAITSGKTGGAFTCLPGRRPGAVSFTEYDMGEV